MSPTPIDKAFPPNPPARFNPVACALFIALAAIAGVMPAQSDTWWLLRSGEEMWRTKQVLLSDIFTHTVAGQYWPNHEWLSQVLFFGTYSIGGLPLLTALCAAAVVTAWACVFRLTPGAMSDRVLLTGSAAALSTAGWSLRPQVLSLALFAFVLSILIRRQRYWWLPPIFLVWANLHGGVAAGGALLVAALAASALADRRTDRRLLVAALLCLVATAVTPLGPSLWLEVPRSLQRLKSYDVLEWRAPSLLNPADWPFWLALAGTGGLVLANRRSLRRWDTLMLTFAAGIAALLALRSARNASLFLLCAVPLAGRLMFAWPAVTPGTAGSSETDRRTRLSQRRSRWPWWATSAMAVGVAVWVGYAWSRPIARLRWQPVSEQMRGALDACRGPLYNRYDEGGYIIWFAREHKVFIDSRQDPFPPSLVQEQLLVEETGEFSQTFARYGIACALSVNGSALARRLDEAGWQRHDAGSGWGVYTRPAGTL